MATATRNSSRTTTSRRDQARKVLSFEPGSRRQSGIRCYFENADGSKAARRRTLVYQAILSGNDPREAARDIRGSGVMSAKQLRQFALESLYKSRGASTQPLKDPAARKRGTKVAEEAELLILKEDYHDSVGQGPEKGVAFMIRHTDLGAKLRQDADAVLRQANIDPAGRNPYGLLCQLAEHNKHVQRVITDMYSMPSPSAGSIRYVEMHRDVDKGTPILEISRRASHGA